jgi:hypothetical protein
MSQLTKLKQGSTRGSRKLTKQDEKKKGVLLKRLYDLEVFGHDAVHFWEQDSDGFPISKVDSDCTLTREPLFDRADWPRRLHRPANFVGLWPPKSIDSLLSTPALGLLCIVCFESKRCKCRYSQWLRSEWNEWETRIQVHKTSDMGYGLFAGQNFEIDDILGEYTGKLLPRNSSRTETESESTYKASIFIGGSGEEDERHPTCAIDAENTGSVFRFLNHSCKPNAELDGRRVGVERRALIATAIRPIKKGEQITICYGESYWKDLGQPCLCGEKECQSSRVTIDKGNEYDTRNDSEDSVDESIYEHPEEKVVDEDFGQDMINQGRKRKGTTMKLSSSKRHKKRKRVS